MFQEKLFLYQFNFSVNLKNKAWAWNQTAMLNGIHPVLITTPYYKAQGGHATFGTWKLSAGQIVLNKEISLITNYLKQSKTKQNPCTTTLKFVSPFPGV